MFRVSLEMLTEAANELHKDAVQLRSCMETMEDVISSLSTFSYMDESRQRLIAEKEAAEAEADKTDLLGRSLSNIAEQYWRSDRQAGDYCEEVKRSLPREKPVFQNIGWVMDLTQMLL